MNTLCVHFMVWILASLAERQVYCLGFQWLIYLRVFDRSIGVDVTFSAEFLIAALSMSEISETFHENDFTFRAIWFGIWRLSISEGFH